MYRKILVAVDLGEQDVAQPALATAVELANLTKGEIRLVHVRHPIPASPLGLVGADVLSDQKAYFDAEMAKLAGAVAFDKARLSTANRLGTVYDQVLDEAREWGADLIVVSAHQPSMATYLLGSNAAKIVRHATCTTLVVRSGKTASLLG
jgi:nucleotide-binding universal stress UspA family protein